MGRPEGDFLGLVLQALYQAKQPPPSWEFTCALLQKFIQLALLTVYTPSWTGEGGREILT